MEKVTALKLHATLSSSFSIHSLAEGSEVISEAEELHEVFFVKILKGTSFAL